MAYQNILEEELKNKIAQDYFWTFDCTRIIGKVDFCVSMMRSTPALFDGEMLLWAEAKTGSADINKSLTQLILTIGKARTFDRHLPPPYLGAFDAEKIAFIPYSDINDFFYQNDFNWNVTPSNYDTKEFQQVHERVKDILHQKALLFHYHKDDKDLKRFIKDNFIVGKFGTTKIKIDKNNFMVVYNKWLLEVKPTIAANWDTAKKIGIIDGDFYLADLLAADNVTLKEKLFVLLKTNYYELDRKVNEGGFFSSSRTDFKDGQKGHNQFWNKYERPPKQEYWDYIVERRDLLVPQDVRERKGSYYTPQIWVELSQRYIADVLGEDWQDEYYVWDCAAGTGNLLAGLTNKYNIWASTLDRQDVEVMKDRIKNGANLLEDHVFQFDFLNDDFDKLPAGLKAIIDDDEKRKKLVVYINPPYAEAASIENISRTGENKIDVAVTTMTYAKYQSTIGIAGRELFAQFITRIYDKMPDSVLAQFSKLKIVQGPNFSKFRNFFRAKFLKGFVCPAVTFDNVSGAFPIGFMIWDLNSLDKIEKISCTIFDNSGIEIGEKVFYAYNENVFITDWLRKYHSRENGSQNIASLGLYGSDFQHGIYIRINNPEQHPNRWTFITKWNLIHCSIYFAVRHCIEATWLNDRDQFLYPNDGWETDTEFQNDCLTYTLFNGNNNIQSAYGTNHWIPFTEQEVNARDKFESRFMTDFIRGKLKPSESSTLQLEQQTHRTTALVFSAEATAVFDAGRALWRYYHTQPGCNVNASLYDIRAHFQGRNETGKMNNKSTDAQYMALITALRDSLKALARKIEPKVYEYGFLKR